MIKGNTENKSSSSSAMDENAVSERPRQRKEAKRGGESQHGEMEKDGSTKMGYREPETDLRFPRTVESSLDFDSPEGSGLRET